MRKMVKSGKQVSGKRVGREKAAALNIASLKVVNDFELELNKIRSILALLNWDQQTIMPKAGGEERGEEIAYLSSKAHEVFLDKKFVKAVNFLAKKENLGGVLGQKKLRVLHLKKEQDKSKKIPVSHVKEFAKLTAKSHHVWVEAREKKDFSIFAPTLKKILKMKVEEARLIGSVNKGKKSVKNQHPYNILLDDYEEGMTIDDIDPVFEELKSGIIDILNEIKKSKKYGLQNQKDKRIGAGVTGASVTGAGFLGKLKFETETQLKICSEIAEKIIGKENKDRYYIANSVHPFTTRLSFNDVRLTTAVRDKQPMFSFTSLSHEAGHALYELGMDKKLGGSCLRDAPSFGLHESQSRLFENQIMRSFAFWKGYYPKYKKRFSALNLKKVSLLKFFEEINKVKPSLVRIECDELTYCLHIIIRYEIEKRMLEGKIKVENLAKIWNENYQKYLGVCPKNDLEGVLQDVHWTEGLFGYFPTYAIGTLYSAMLWEKMKEVNVNLDKELSKGDFTFVREWLKENVHKFGRTKSSKQIIKRACGKDLTAKPFLKYLREKYFKLYGIKK